MVDNRPMYIRSYGFVVVFPRWKHPNCYLLLSVVNQLDKHNCSLPLGTIDHWSWLVAPEFSTSLKGYQALSNISNIIR